MSAPVATANQDMAMVYHAVFSTPQGRIVLEHILNRVCALDTPITTVGGELNMASQVGARNIGLIIKALATAPLTSVRPNVQTEKPTNE